MTNTNKLHRLPRLRSIATLLAVTAGSLSAAAPAHAAPVPANTPWQVLLCRAKGTTLNSGTIERYHHLFAEHDATSPTLWDYWFDVSFHQLNLLQSATATDWHDVDKTVVQLQSESRGQKLQDCMTAAGVEAANPDSMFGVTAVYNVNFTQSTDTKNFGDSGSTGPYGSGNYTLNGVTKPYAGIVVEPWADYPSFYEHEMGHAYGLEHAFSYNGCSPVGPIGEYCDPYDTMGQSGGAFEFEQPIYRSPTGSNGADLAGPGLSAYPLEKLGWMPAARKALVNVTTNSSQTVTLTSLSSPNPTGNLIAHVDIGAGPDNYFTVEYRRALGWDRGIPTEGVVIHSVNSRPVPGHHGPLSYLLTRTPTSGWLDGAFQVDDAYNGSDVSIKVTSINPTTNTATILITGPAPIPPSPPGGVSDNGQGAGGCGASGCGQHRRPGPIPFA